MPTPLQPALLILLLQAAFCSLSILEQGIKLRSVHGILHGPYFASHAAPIIAFLFYVALSFARRVRRTLPAYTAFFLALLSSCTRAATFPVATVFLSAASLGCSLACAIARDAVISALALGISLWTCSSIAHFLLLNAPSSFASDVILSALATIVLVASVQTSSSSPPSISTTETETITSSAPSVPPRLRRSVLRTRGRGNRLAFLKGLPVNASLARIRSLKFWPLAAALLGVLLSAAIGAPLSRVLVNSVYPRRMPGGYRLLARQRSVTGLISVLEDFQRQMRVLISDHSILGGAYTAKGYEHESIFAQFHVHEAVRLSRTPGEAPGEKGGREGNVLAIGLGMGVVSQALHDLGSNVTVLEIDSVVAKFAKSYFGFRGPNVLIGDAEKFLSQPLDADKGNIDYVIHDVFTGGAVPLNMFSVETFKGLKKHMKKDGVLALNFVGALENPDMPATRAVAAVQARLKQVFSYVTAFKEGTKSPVQNVVFFASDTEERMSFREPIERDFLRSSNRETALMEFEKHRIGELQLGKDMPIEEASDDAINAGQWITAREHWKAMRTILPKQVWVALAAHEG